jgi:hypothetical protein
MVERVSSYGRRTKSALLGAWAVLLALPILSEPQRRP